MVRLFRVPKVPILSNRTITNFVTSQLKKGITFGQVNNLLKLRGVKFNQGDLRNAYQELNRGQALAGQLDRFKPSDRLPNYMFIEQHGRALDPYKVNVTFRMQNKVTGNEFERTIDMGFENRPTKDLIYNRIDQTTNDIIEFTSVDVLGSDINYLSTTKR